MSITAIRHFDEILGNGYYLVSEYMDKTWYKGDTAEEAVRSYLSKHGTIKSVTIIEKR